MPRARGRDKYSHGRIGDVPWCDTCARFWTPTSVDADGACPTCGRSLAPKAAHEKPGEPVTVTAADLDLKELAGEDAKAPWHFKLLVVLVVLYLAWRIVDLIFGIV
ncbi:MAG TPA: hypothetical protein VG478_12860 [Acidimicrobiales bacterium]|nr:hypothetical protein [Acidimicrobiales bacterium]